MIFFKFFEGLEEFAESIFIGLFIWFVVLPLLLVGFLISYVYAVQAVRYYLMIKNKTYKKKGWSFMRAAVVEADDGNLRQHRTEIVRYMRSQIFRQIVQKFRRHTVVCQEISVQDDGKYVPQGHFLRAQQMTYKAVRRSLCGVALKLCWFTGQGTYYHVFRGFTYDDTLPILYRTQRPQNCIRCDEKYWRGRMRTRCIVAALFGVTFVLLLFYSLF